jgi:hypothetical protein
MDTVISLIVFGVLLGVSLFLVLRVPPRYTIDKKKEIDYRVVLFTLRLALTFGIGAAVVGTLLVASQFVF